MATVDGTPQLDGVKNVDEALAWDQEVLDALAPKMVAALEARRAGEDSVAEKLLRDILRNEPRLAEPRLELAHLAAEREQWEEARTQAELAVTTLRAGGQWTLDVEPPALLSFALNLLGEVIVRWLEEGDLLLRDRPEFTRRWNEAAGLFADACRLDGTNDDARRNQTRYRPLK